MAGRLKTVERSFDNKVEPCTPHHRLFDNKLSFFTRHPELSLMCLRRHMTTPGLNVNFAIFQLGRLLMENSRKYTSLSGSLS